MADRTLTVKDENGTSHTFTYTDKQLRFIDKYLEHLNGTRAAREAGYRGNDNTLSTVAYENLRKPKIAMLLKQRMAVECMSSTEALMHLAKIARGVDVTRYVYVEKVEGEEETHTFYHFDIDKFHADGYGDLIKTMTPVKSGVRIEFHDRLGALNSVARHYALFTDVIIGAEVNETDKELLEDDEREAFAAAVIKRITERRE